MYVFFFVLSQTPVIGCREMYTGQQLEILKHALSGAIASPGQLLHISTCNIFSLEFS